MVKERGLLYLAAADWSLDEQNRLRFGYISNPRDVNPPGSLVSARHERPHMSFLLTLSGALLGMESAEAWLKLNRPVETNQTMKTSSHQAYVDEYSPQQEVIVADRPDGLGVGHPPLCSLGKWACSGHQPQIWWTL